MNDLKPQCWFVGDKDGGHVVFYQSDADQARSDGWPVIPLVGMNTATLAIRSAKAEVWDEGYESAFSVGIADPDVPNPYREADRD